MMICLFQRLLSTSRFLLPLLALFLLPVWPVSAQTTYFLAPDGDDRDPGTLEQPWRTLAHAVEQLAPGVGLVLREGRYPANSLAINTAGEADLPMRIQGYPGETAVIGTSHQEFLQPGNDQWERVDDAINLYRSKRTYPIHRLAVTLEEAGAFLRLNPYERLEDLTSTSQSWSDSAPIYVGPGAHHAGDGHIYIRLERVDPAAVGRAFERPASADPNRNRLHISTAQSAFLIGANARHLEIDNLNIEGYRHCLRIDDAAFLKLSNLTMRCGTIAVVMFRTHDVQINNVTFHHDLPDWISWTDIKSGRRPARLLKTAAIGLGEGVHHVDVSGSRFFGVFDGIEAISEGLHHVRVHHNLFHTRDDALQLASSAYEILFDHNLIVGPGPSHDGSGDTPKPGTKYIHHNIIDTRAALFWGRDDPLEQLKPYMRGWGPHRPLSSHNDDGFLDPWKIYQNTFVLGDGLGIGGVGLGLWGRPSPDAPHEVYNNIIQQEADAWLTARLDVAVGGQILDGNLYHRAAASEASTPFFRDMTMGEENQHFNSLVAFKESAFGNATEVFYRQGWEQGGIEADPGLGAIDQGDYRPLIDGAASAPGIVDLRPTGWPGASAEPFRGALDPYADGGTGDVGPLAAGITQ